MESQVSALRSLTCQISGMTHVNNKQPKQFFLDKMGGGEQTGPACASSQAWGLRGGSSPFPRGPTGLGLLDSPAVGTAFWEVLLHRALVKNTKKRSVLRFFSLQKAP